MTVLGLEGTGDPVAMYRSYIDALNTRNWGALGAFVHGDVSHNGRALGLAGYRRMLEEDVRLIPDLQFRVDTLVCDASTVAARLLFDCTPAGHFLGLAVDGRRVSFSENVFYGLKDGKLHTVWSLIDKAAIEAQLR